MQDSAAETKDRNGQGIKQYKSALNKNGQEADAEKEEKRAFAGRKTSPLLQVSHLTFAYPDGKMILDDISFSARKGSDHRDHRPGGLR